MPELDNYESAIIQAYNQGKLKSVTTKSELAKFKAAARASRQQAQKNTTHSNLLK